MTLLFTDIEGGVGLWEADRDAMAAASARHDRMVREQVEASGGHVFQAVGEAHRAVFADPVAALVSAVAIQRAAGAEPWPSGLPVRVCVALHCGVCAERDGDYAGPVVNRAARLLDAGHGGQVLVTAAAYALLAGRLPGGIGLRDLGEQRLRDLGRAERVFQVTGPGLAGGFGVLRSLDHPALRHNLPSQATSSGSATGASSASHTPSPVPSRASAAACSASRDLPIPPGPAIVTSRDPPAISARSSASSATRPTKLVAWDGRLWRSAGWSRERSTPNPPARPGPVTWKTRSAPGGSKPTYAGRSRRPVTRDGMIRTNSSRCPAGHGSTPAARWIATADKSAATGSANTARCASPTVLKTCPPDASTSSRTMRSWRADAAAIASRSASHSQTPPSISVNSNVTKPAVTPTYTF